MRHPRRLLSAYLDGELPQRRRTGLEAHLRRCPACRSELYGQQALRRRMHDMSEPAPDLLLPSRILSAASLSGAEAPGPRPVRTGHRRLAVTGVLAVVTLLLAAAGYALGGEAPQVPDAAAAMTARWAAPAADDTAVLSEPDLLVLRSAGWNCPLLPELGFGLVQASGHRIDGSPALKLELSNGRNSLVIFEQPNGAAPDDGPEGGTPATPVSAVTGVRVDGTGYTLYPLQAGEEHGYWLRTRTAASGWEAVVPTDGADYTLTSDLPASRLDSTVAQLVATHESRVRPWQPTAPENLLERIRRGLAKIIEPEGIW